MKMTSRIAFVIAAFLSAPAFADDSADLLARLRAAYPSTSFSSVSATPVPGLFEVVMGRNLAYVGHDVRHFVLGGRIFDMQTQRDLTSSRLDELKRVDFASLPLGDAVTVKRGTGAREVAVFADPNCGYCRRMEQELARVGNVTVHTFIIALLSADSLEKGRAVWCAADRAKAWTALMSSGKMPSSTPCDSPLERNALLAQRLGIQATPTLISRDGRIQSGYLDNASLNAWLGVATPGMAVAPSTGESP